MSGKVGFALPTPPMWPWQNGETTVVLSIVLSRLYTLRNQLVHGGATWNGSVNRDQLRDGCAIMSKLTPLLIELMMDNPDALWGDPVFPVVG